MTDQKLSDHRKVHPSVSKKNDNTYQSNFEPKGILTST